jgi:hypothetical protein
MWYYLSGFASSGVSIPLGTNRRTFGDFSPKGPTPTAGLSSARIGDMRSACKTKSAVAQSGRAMPYRS